MYKGPINSVKALPRCALLSGNSLLITCCPFLFLKSIRRGFQSTTKTTLTTDRQTGATDSESRLALFINKGIDPYPRFNFLSPEYLNVASSNPSSSEEPKSFPSSGYDSETLRNVKQKHSFLHPTDLKGPLPFNDLAALKKHYLNIDSGARIKEATMVIAGRILSRRDASAKLIFYDVMINHTKIQIVASLGNFLKDSIGLTFGEAHEFLRRGDIVRFVGFVGKSNAGELSIFAVRPPQLLAPCLPDMPLAAQLGSSEQRFRRRSLSLLLHEPTARAVLIRAKVLQSIRKFLDTRGFLEVETPILATQAGGAAARPFTAHCRALGLPLHLRISPELYLKQMVVGGFDRVYEIGRVFRNEGVDATHNPEFTTCEFYVAYANLETLFSLTEELLCEVAQDAIGSLDVNAADGVISFQAPFRRIHVVEELTRLLGPLPPLDGPVEPYLELCNGHSIEVTPPLTMTRVLEALIGGLIEPQCTQPTFLYGHPLIMSPLAKAVDGTSALAARFELFIAQHEFINAYEELNSPGEQLSRFNAQLKDRQELGDFEIPELNEEFCEALSYGLPPTAGWGLGVDRLVALLSQSPNIRSTLTFPLLRSSKEVE